MHNEPNSPSSPGSSTKGGDGMEMSDIAPVVKAKLRNMVDSGRDRVVQWRDGVQEGIRERPLQSILIAAVAGAVIGVILGRRSR
jgi:ElaB/YqjD/DUF883 family membrane-anchored ribosome-binding protein